MLDYRKLLHAYIAFVRDVEGTDYLFGDPLGASAVVTPEELRQLKAVAKGGLPEEIANRDAGWYPFPPPDRQMVLVRIRCCGGNTRYHMVMSPQKEAFPPGAEWHYIPGEEP